MKVSTATAPTVDDCTEPALEWCCGPNSISELAPARGFEPRTLRLTDRRRPFRNAGPNSLSASECRQLQPFATGVAALGRRSSRGRAGRGGNTTRGSEPGRGAGARRPEGRVVRGQAAL